MHFTGITKICLIYLQQKPIHTYQVLVSLDVNEYIPGTLVQRNNMGKIGNMRIRMGKFFGSTYTRMNNR